LWSDLVVVDSGDYSVHGSGTCPFGCCCTHDFIY
jgi:hypothetical protein